MDAALILLAVLAAAALLLYAHHRLTQRREADKPLPPEAQAAEPQAQEEEQCCGMHIECEKDSLLASVSAQVEYYDDEELDRFKGRGPADYNDEEIEEFRDVLLTLQPYDIAGWGRSLQLRGIELPAIVKDELLMVVAEARRSKSPTHP